MFDETIIKFVLVKVVCRLMFLRVNMIIMKASMLMSFALVVIQTFQETSLVFEIIPSIIGFNT